MIHHWKGVLDEYKQWLCSTYDVTNPMDAFWDKFEQNANDHRSNSVKNFEMTILQEPQRTKDLGDPRITKLKDTLVNIMPNNEPVFDNLDTTIGGYTVAVTQYKDGNSFMGWHQDRPRPFTIIVSLGAPRVILFRKKSPATQHHHMHMQTTTGHNTEKNEDDIRAYILESGDVIAFDQAFNLEHEHMIPPTSLSSSAKDPRRLALVIYQHSRRVSPHLNAEFQRSRRAPSAQSAGSNFQQTIPHSSSSSYNPYPWGGYVGFPSPRFH